jgi:pimeloyl-ACP methyl ester carboxylesterase
VPRDRDYRYTYDDEVIRGTLGDINYLLNHLHRLGSISKLCNPDRIVVMGHSLGGNIAHNFGFKDKRITAIVDIDSKITERKILDQLGIPKNHLKTPVLFIRGALQYQEEVGEQLTTVQNATIWSPSVEHSAFSDNAYLTAKIAGFGKQEIMWTLYNWFFKVGPFWDATDTSIGGQAIEEWIAEYRSYVVQWLSIALPPTTDPMAP